ncbi:fibronectin type III domain-containing protein [Eubacterium ventriosum]|uniref:fibronectin type III domain-containing protein n=1 Tax=Eubacterium ventriosum TaxID=39496 RepID=UPI0035206D9A
MRKKFMAMMLSACMVLSCINAPSYAMADEPTVRILENKGDMYTLENYVTSLKEAEQIQKKFFEEGIYEYSISFDSGVEWKVDVEEGSFIDSIDGPESRYYNESMHFRIGIHSTEKEIITKSGHQYTKISFDFTELKESFKQYNEKRAKMQEVKKKFLATMPNLDEMSDYEKVLGILSFMSYIKYGRTDDGRTIDDAYTALVKGKATCTGYANAFNFLAKTIKLDSVEIYKSGVHSWNAVKVCGKWYELEPQSKNNPSSVDAVKNINMTTVLRGTDTMLTMGAIYSEADFGNKMHPIDARTNLPISNIDYMDYKGHSYTNHTIKWDGSKATFYRTCSECGEYENDGFEYDEKNKFYHMVDRKYIGTDCDVTKVSEKKCGDATVTKYEANVTVDGKNYTSEHTVVDGEASHTVKDSDIKVIKEATCSEEGKVEKTCETCGYTWTENIPKTEHHYVTTTTKLDTCEEKSEYTVEKCSECGDVKSTSKKLYYSAHDFQFTSHKKEPTCTETGEDIYTCTKCNKTETREVAATGHDTELINVKEPTCTDFGYSGDEVCKKCNQVVKSGKNIEPNGHKYLATMFTKYEIQESMGLKYKYSYEAEHWICKNCDYERIDTDYTTRKLVGWILADGTEVEKEDGCNYVYIRDENGNFVPQKVENTTTTRPTTNMNVATKAPRETTTKVKVPAKVKISSAKNLKGKKIAIKWKKVKTATKYQVKAVLGSKAITKTTTKTSYTIKKLKRKKTYKIYVRAYNKAGYGKWSKVKKVYIKK